jgi:hypothetical protein
MRDTYQSVYEFEDVKLGMRFDFGNRKWEVLSKSTYVFDAKTVDGHPGVRAVFKYKK